MNIGYARTSTLDQKAGFDAQLQELDALGVERVYKEQVSATSQRPELQAALDYIRDGDTLIVTKLDRLARSVKHLGEIVEMVEAKNAHLRILNLGIDTSDPTGKLVLNLLGSVAQFEREMMLERQREGIAKAKERGVKFGRPKKLSDERLAEMKAEFEAGVIGKAALATKYGISKPSLYRLVR